mgnify:FL=1|tara:strand:+ start:1823 stop:2062 length:240 start_codon:yes stop_codon:yes gene_type:complete
MNIIKSYSKLSNELKDLLNETYPAGFASVASKVNLKDGQYLVIPFIYQDVNYLIKIKKLSVDKRTFDVTKMMVYQPEGK